MTDSYFGPSGCTATGFACFPYIILGELSQDGARVTVKAPTSIKEAWPSVAAVLVARCEDDQNPRHLTPQEVLAFVAKGRPNAATAPTFEKRTKRNIVNWLRALVAG